jgi:hypothetical protein
MSTKKDYKKFVVFLFNSLNVFITVNYLSRVYLVYELFSRPTTGSPSNELALITLVIYSKCMGQKNHKINMQ